MDFVYLWQKTKGTKHTTVNHNNQTTNDKQITITKIPNGRFYILILDLDIVI